MARNNSVPSKVGIVTSQRRGARPSQAGIPVGKGLRREASSASEPYLQAPSNNIVMTVMEKHAAAPRQPSFQVMAKKPRNGDFRVHSEEARLRGVVVSGRERVEETQKNQQQQRVQRNLNTQPETSRAKSLNPLIYPAWWGDVTTDDKQQRPPNPAREPQN